MSEIRKFSQVSKKHLIDLEKKYQKLNPPGIRALEYLDH
jgi:hypothetical protein